MRSPTSASPPSTASSWTCSRSNERSNRYSARAVHSRIGSRGQHVEIDVGCGHVRTPWNQLKAPAAWDRGVDDAGPSINADHRLRLAKGAALDNEGRPVAQQPQDFVRGTVDSGTGPSHQSCREE